MNTKSASIRDGQIRAISNITVTPANKFSSRLEIGKKMGSGGLIQGKRENRGASVTRGKYDDADVLLRRRA
jgi:hypothetical protein